MAKLVEILARELNEWPENFPHALLSQSVSGRVAYVINNKERVSVGVFDKADDWLDALVDKREWQAAVDALYPKLVVAEAWDGGGLPPVGTVCEFRIPEEFGDVSLWRQELRNGHMVEIIYHYDSGISKCAVFSFKVDFGHLVEQATADCFRPIRTAEQIAAEEREKAVKELYYTINWSESPDHWSHVSGERKADYAKAIEAGYRKQEQK